MKAVKYMIKTVIWSLGISVGIRIVFGLYSVFGPIILLIPFALAIIASFSLSTSSNTGLVAVSLFHMILTTGAYIFFDYSGLFLTLASDTADFFSRFASSDSVRVNLLWCILFVMPVYFFCFVVTSGIISAVNNRRRQADTEYDNYEDYYDSDGEDRVSYTK